MRKIIDLDATEWEPEEAEPIPEKPVPYWIPALFIVLVIALLR
jgi:hypothetical protein